MHGISALARRLAVRAVDLALPRFCLGCGSRLPAAAPGLPLCFACRGRLEPVDPRRSCRGCLRPLPRERSEAPLCGSCRRAPPPFDRALALWRYRPPLDAVLRAFKFHGLDFLGKALARAGAERLSGLPALDLDRVVPVPLAWPRRLVRGYNQAERFARPLADAVGATYVEPLGRRLVARRQSGLPRSARVENIRGSFFVRRPRLVERRAVLLVDDIFTTGSTARAAAAALLAGGASSVVVLAAAWTPLEGTPDEPPEPSGTPAERLFGFA